MAIFSKKIQKWFWAEYETICLLFWIFLLMPFVGHFLMTGSPIPWWHIESLNAPVPVRTVTEASLILEDGREVHLPFIEQLPKDDPLFLASIQEGIEISENGRVSGLLWIKRNCGNDATWWIRRKFDLSDLAGALYPEGIDEDRIHQEVKSYLCEDRISRSSIPLNTKDVKLSAFDVHKIRRVRELFENAEIREELDRLEREGSSSV